MAKTYEQHIKDQRADADKQVQEAAAQKQAADRKALATATKLVDEQTALQKQPYEERMEQADGEYQALFDRHALQEELGRQAVELRLANLGLSDSGLAASSQAALTARRMNADADARLRLKEYVDELRSAIHELEAKGKTQKNQLKLKSDAAYDKWYATTKKTAYTQADKTAKALYEAEQKALAARLKNQAANGGSSGSSGSVGSSGTSGSSGGTAGSSGSSGGSSGITGKPVIPSVKTAAEALRQWAETVIEKNKGSATGSSPATAEKQDDPVETAREQAVRKAAEAAVAEIDEMDASSGGIFNSTFWLGSEGDGEDVYQDVVEEQLAEQESFRALSKEGKAQAIAMAIGRSVALTWPDFGELRSNMTRVEKALDMAKEAYGWTDKEYAAMRALAKQTYNKQNGF